MDGVAAVADGKDRIRHRIHHEIHHPFTFIQAAGAVVDGGDGQALVAQGDGDEQASFADEGSAAILGGGDI